MTQPLSGAGHHHVAAPPEAVWRALNDPDALRAVIPGAISVERVDPARFAARLSFGVGPLRAVNTVSLTLEREGRLCRLAGEAAGRFGGGHATAAVTLETDATGTSIDWRYTGGVTGAYALLGPFVLGRASAWFVTRFFAGLAARLTSLAAPPPGTADAPPCPATRTAPSPP